MCRSWSTEQSHHIFGVPLRPTPRSRRHLCCALFEGTSQQRVKNPSFSVRFQPQDVIPNEWENIIIENNDNVKQLNYVKLNSILWGVCREQQSKIEHLETRLFEVENFIKDYIKPKPKPKAKNKSK